MQLGVFIEQTFLGAFLSLEGVEPRLRKLGLLRHWKRKDGL